MRSRSTPALSPPPWPPQLGAYGGLTDEIEALKRDKNVLMMELVRLRQAQQVSPRGGGRGRHRSQFAFLWGESALGQCGEAG